ncbi:MAG: XTP/dITP diphosphatase [Candidatus Thermoplasmatota archaeon]|jgi:XTP/dITP diphosphohydrolase|nr:XTP/dITP diphosphatase [Candidatus Thermoplasmatota archaeon]MCL5791133.1 XTP/dITP diphosphatase [Candidatus Thermoplasmatota archaeon]
MRLRFVTSNEHKFREISAFLAMHGDECEWVRMKYEEIQDDTTESISLASARFLRGKVPEPFFLEDTGLYIDSLKGFPGPYSSYVQSTIGNSGILSLLKEKGREASFRTVISYVSGDGIEQFTGILKGSIAQEERGASGFGFDPIFIPRDSSKSLAEMSIDEKNQHSHRINALKLFIAHLEKSQQ